MKDPPQPSVYPYPSMKGAQITHFKKSITSADIGAEPESIYLTLPPNASLVLLNTMLSQNLCST